MEKELTTANNNMQAGNTAYNTYKNKQRNSIIRYKQNVNNLMLVLQKYKMKCLVYKIKKMSFKIK